MHSPQRIDDHDSAAATQCIKLTYFPAFSSIFGHIARNLEQHCAANPEKPGIRSS